METSNTGTSAVHASAPPAYGYTGSNHNVPPAYTTHDAPPQYSEVTSTQNAGHREADTTRSYGSIQAGPYSTNGDQPILGVVSAQPQMDESQRLISDNQWADYVELREWREGQRCKRRCGICMSVLILVITFIVWLVIRFSDTSD